MANLREVRHSATLTGKQHAAIDALLACHTVGDAAEVVGVNRRTLHRWLNEPAFAQALQDAQDELTRGAIRRLTGMVHKAVNEVERLIEGGEDESVRLRAALAVSTNDDELAALADGARKLVGTEVEDTLLGTSEH